MPGETMVAGRYLVGRLLGQGGMGRVHAAWDTILERRVALKTLRGGAAHRDEDVARFRAEARNAASLSHSNIARVFDAGEDNGVSYIAMELVEGGTLAEAIDVHGPLSPTRAASLALEIAEALAAAHKNGIVHQDIKPQNILIDDQGHARIVDFGIAAPFGRPDTGRARTVEGTAAYLSPEQVGGMAASPMSDLYSLGVVFYEMLAGRPPFARPEGDELAVARTHLTEHPVPPHVYTSWLPEDLEGLVLRLLSKDPDQRPPSARALARELEKLVSLITAPTDPTPDPDAGPAGPTALTHHAPGRLRRVRRLTTLAVFMGVALAVGFVTLASASPTSVPAFVPPRVVGAAAELGGVSASTLVKFHDRAGEHVGSVAESLSGVFSRTVGFTRADAPDTGTSEATAPVRQKVTTKHHSSGVSLPETTGAGRSTQGFSKPEAPVPDDVRRRDLSPRQTFDPGPAKQTP